MAASVDEPMVREDVGWVGAVLVVLEELAMAMHPILVARPGLHNKRVVEHGCAADRAQLPVMHRPDALAVLVSVAILGDRRHPHHHPAQYEVVHRHLRVLDAVGVELPVQVLERSAVALVPLVLRHILVVFARVLAKVDTLTEESV
eukprot:5520337-Prymnesium_polylepis.1